MDASQLATFKRQGFCVVRGLIPLDQVDKWRAEAWGALTINEEDAPRTWPSGGNRNEGLMTPDSKERLVYPYTDTNAVADPRPFTLPVGDQPQVKSVLDQLLGEGTYGKGIAAAGEQGHLLEPEVVVFNWPLPPEERPEDPYNGVDARDRPGGHIEGYRGYTKGGPTPQWQVACTTYLDDVGPGGGSTYVWPRSHLACHRYFLQYPGDIPTGGAICTSRPHGAVHGIPPPRKGMDPLYGSGQISGMSERYMRANLPGGYDGGEPHEAVMAKGDVMFWQ